jgi:hypothetical protein
MLFQHNQKLVLQIHKRISERYIDPNMLDYSHQRAIAALKIPQTAVLATYGPAGVMASEFPCESIDLVLYLLLPQISDHLFNLEQDDRVALLTEEWELRGIGRVLSPEEKLPELSLLHKVETEWYILVKVEPFQIQLRRSEGWGVTETIDFVIRE